MNFTVKDIIYGTSGVLNSISTHQAIVKNISFDSRKIANGEHTLFVALAGKRDGHGFIEDAYAKGVRTFLISKDIELEQFVGSSFIRVENTLAALQLWATHHRDTIKGKVIAITGSNGKTIVKEWLSEYLGANNNVGKSPLSYNSQLGVALSLLNISPEVDYAIIEAGISQKGEMAKLAAMIKPDLGILTNLGDAHDEGFENKATKLREKLLLFDTAKSLIYNADDPLVSSHIESSFRGKKLSWGKKSDNYFEVNVSKDYLTISNKGIMHSMLLPSLSRHMIDSSIPIIIHAIWDNLEAKDISDYLSKMSQLPNRLEIKSGIQNSIIINDSYSSDIKSMQLAMEYLGTFPQHKKRILITTPLAQQKDTSKAMAELSQLIQEHNISTVVAISHEDSDMADIISDPDVYSYTDINNCIINLPIHIFKDSIVLIKGARKYRLERLADHLAAQVHKTVLETNLSAVKHNIDYYRSLTEANTKIMAVVKADAYGSGSQHMINILEQEQIDYLAVALIDEGIRLREQGCQLPIMIFNVQDRNLDQLWQYDLEPVVYNQALLSRLLSVSHRWDKPLNIHLEIDSGMHRLGFSDNELTALDRSLADQEYLIAKSIFSHLATSEASDHDDFTKLQIAAFDKAYDQISKTLEYRPMRHILNTAGIVRHPEAQYDMVRLGLGMYGIDETDEIQNKLRKVHTLRAKVLQVKLLKKGESTGYSRSGVASTDRWIAIVSIGYADGLFRLLGNGNHRFRIGDQTYPTIGSVCMDVLMLDLGENTDVKRGDEVVIFGPDDPIEALATSCNTISYEIISRLSPRIPRTFVHE